VRASFDPFELGRVEVKIGEPEMSCLLIELIGPADLKEGVALKRTAGLA